MATGIRTRHQKECRSREGGRCSCKPAYEAWVYAAQSKKKIRQSFRDLAAAKKWRAEAIGAVQRRELQPATKTTVREAAEAWLAGARDGTIRTKAGQVYKPSAIRTYEGALRLRVYDDLGGRRLSDVQRVELQAFADKLLAQGLDASTISVTLQPLRAIYRHAIRRGQVAVNPTTGLELPTPTGARTRIADPAEAAQLLAAVPAQDRAIWATAMYAGLRRGELLALRWEDIDLATGLIRVERSWDAKEGVIEPKSKKGRRSVPIAAVLRDHLVERRMTAGRDAGLALGLTAADPFVPMSVSKRARDAWSLVGLSPITLHECRHTFASLMIAAGVNAKALSTYMGHANITVTLDRYGHLMPGNEAEAAGLLDSYLERANSQARLAQLNAGTGASAGAPTPSEPSETAC